MYRPLYARLWLALFRSEQFNSNYQPDSHTHPAKDKSEGEKALFDALIDASRRTRRVSFLSLAGVFVTVALAVLVTLFAGLITNIDASAALIGARSDLLEQEDLRRQQTEALDTSNARLQFIEQMAIQAQSAFIRSQLEVQAEATQNAESASAGFSELIVSGPDLGLLEGSDVAPSDSFDSITDEYSALLVSTDRLRSEVLRTESRMEKTENTIAELTREAAGFGESREALIASAVTRFGAMGVLLFFAQSLINLYRYTLTLASSLESKAYAIVASANAPETFKDAIDAFSVETISFGRRAKTPIEEAIKILEALRPNSSGK
ncbi:MAG: hypothetical protein AAGA70_08235 [Pseudomonadota bacterium]